MESMRRGKIEVKRIENNFSRQVTFSKRRAGLIKKTHELSVLCDAQIGLIVFSNKGKLFEYSTHPFSMREIIEKYLKTTGTSIPPAERNHREQMLEEMTRIKNETLILQLNLQHYKGEDLKFVHFEELNALEHKLQLSLDKVRARKFQLLQQQLDNLMQTEKQVSKENQDMYEWLMSNNKNEKQGKEMEHDEVKLLQKGQPYYYYYYPSIIPSSSTSLSSSACMSFDHHQFPYSEEIAEQQQLLNDNNNNLHLHLQQQPRHHLYASSSSSSSFRLQPTQPFSTSLHADDI